MPGTNGEDESCRWTKLWRRLCRKWRKPVQRPLVEKREIHLDNRSLTVAPDVRASVHGEELALLHISTGRVFLCNRTGSRIWQGVVAGLSARAIADEISRDCGVGWELVLRHTASFLFELERHGLVIPRIDSSC